MTTEGHLVGGRYRLDRRIGSGAMGVVWQGYDARLRRAVAIKQLRLEPGLDPSEAEEARQRAMREGRIAARLQHANAVPVYDVVDEGGAPWLVMEYVPSRSLAAEMAERGVLQPEEVGRIGAQIAHALVAAHAAGIVHRDIKPANILIGDNGTVKITDFGISRAAGDVAVTKTGLIAGTPAYLAPEVAYGRSPGAPSDVFSLGSTLYAAVEGEPPFGLSENTLSLLHAVARGQINPPQQAGILTDVLIALLNPDPQRRPTMTTAAWWLDTVAAGRRPSIEPIGPATMAGMSAPTVALNPAGPPRTRTAPPLRPQPTRATAFNTADWQDSPRTDSPRTDSRRAAPVDDFDEPRRSRRPMVLTGIGVVAVAALAAILVLSSPWQKSPSGSNVQQVNQSGPSAPDNQGGNVPVQLPNQQPSAGNTPTHHTRTSETTPSTDQQVTPTTPTETTPTTTEPTETTPTTPSTPSSSSPTTKPPTSGSTPTK